MPTTWVRRAAACRGGIELAIVLTCWASLAPSARADDVPVAAPPGAGVRALAPPDPAPVDLGSLPDLVVRAPTLTLRSVFETPAPVNVVSRERIEREQPRSFSDAIRFQPGLWSTQGSAGQMGTPVVRGTMGNQVLLLLDGVRVSNSLFTIGPGQDWDLIDMQAIDHVEVVRSPDAVLYGTQGIGGTTALYSRFPVEFTAGGTVSGGRAFVLGAMGGENLWRARVQGHVASPGFRAVAGITRTDADDMEAGGDVGRLAPTRFGSWAGDLRMEARTRAGDVIGFSFYAIEKSWPGRFTAPKRTYDNDADRQVGLLRWVHPRASALGDDVEVRLALARSHRVYERQDNFNRDEQEVWTPQLDVIAHRRVGARHLLTYGLHAHDDEVSASVTTAAGEIKAVPDGWLRTAGGYLQDEWSVTDRLRLTGGVRFDFVNVVTRPEAATTDPLVNIDDLRVDRSDTAWTGKLAAFYRATSALGLTASLSRGYRFPGPSDLTIFRQAPDEIQVGSPDLHPETSTVLDLGAHVRTRRWRVGVVGYVSWLEDLIIGQPGTLGGVGWADRNGNLVQDADEEFSVRQNAGSATFRGLELEAEVQLARAWTLFGNFTTWHGDITPEATEPIGVPTNGTVGLRCAPPGGRWWAEGSCHLVARFDQIPEAFYNEEQFFWRHPQDASSGPLRSDHSLPGYATFDLRAGVRVSRRWEWTFGIENLLDKAYRPFGARHDGPGATFTLSTSIDL